MTIMFNPAYIGPNPPCCDTECTDPNNCPVPECGPCPGPQSPCGGCAPPIDPGVCCAVTIAPEAAPKEASSAVSQEEPKDCEACSNKTEITSPPTPATEPQQ